MFRKLTTSLVESTMLYGTEIWGCNRNMEGVEQTQLRALRMFFGVGTLHPKASLLAEMGDLPVRWQAKLGVCCSGSGYCQVRYMMVI